MMCLYESVGQLEETGKEFLNSFIAIEHCYISPGSCLIQRALGGRGDGTALRCVLLCSAQDPKTTCIQTSDSLNRDPRNLLPTETSRRSE